MAKEEHDEGKEEVGAWPSKVIQVRREVNVPFGGLLALLLLVLGSETSCTNNVRASGHRTNADSQGVD